jgi:hypothetical protein
MEGGLIANDAFVVIALPYGSLGGAINLIDLMHLSIDDLAK